MNAFKPGISAARRLLAGILVLVLAACAAADSAPEPAPRTSGTPTLRAPTRIQGESPVVFRTGTSTAEPPEAASVEGTAAPLVTISAVDGNLFIRRGADMAFNPIGVLYAGTGTRAIGRDILSKWVQVELPDSDSTGWISIQTRFSTLTGDPASLPVISPTDWPTPAYLRNCTYHRMYILPGEIILPSALEYPENEIWLYPGRYTVYDLDVPDEPEVQEVDMREGIEIEIWVDGLGEKRKCH